MARTLTDAQVRAIADLATVYGTDRMVGDPAEVVGLSKARVAERYPDGSVEIFFTYIYAAGHFGLEATVFALDGSIVTSQDLG